MDALSDILRVVRLSGAIFFHARFTAPFCYAAARTSDLAQLVEPGAERLVIFHLITQGECWIELDGCEPGLGRMLLAGLPPVVKAPLRGTEAWSWLEASVGYALSEARSERPGGAGVLAKLAEVLFIEVLRK